MPEETLQQRVRKLEAELRQLREEARFWEQVFEHIPMMAFVKDAADLRFIRYSKAGAALVGVPSEELLGKTDYDFFPREEADFFTSKDREVLASGELLDIPQEPIQIEGKGQRWLHTKKIPIFSEAGEPLYLVGIAEDITERLELEESIRRRTEELEAANEEIRSLNARLAEENLRLSAELDVARRIQQMVLPTPGELHAVHELDIAGYMTPADEVGGDYYDVLQAGDTIKIGIGDVTGHGLESGVVMLWVQTAVRALLAAGLDDPELFFQLINSVLFENLKRAHIDRHLTLLLLDYQDHRLRITGQHEELLLLRAGGALERIDTMDLGLPVGLDPDIAPFVSSVVVDFAPGDIAVLYTDGIPEAPDPGGELYGMERFCEVLRGARGGCAKDIRDAVIEALMAHIGEAPVLDDVTLVVVRAP
ncbi:MAG: SpoIIE family protein phosphatase [Alphaproteobacteria bacterium]|nr:SpoIIE family protein phosphatase [Alphaproteobacteria bacterium]MCB9794962.1 SpoIIE family protein phosphatase [Alphaproteobacteria bacterium]